MPSYIEITTTSTNNENHIGTSVFWIGTCRSHTGAVWRRSCICLVNIRRDSWGVCAWSSQYRSWRWMFVAIVRPCLHELPRILHEIHRRITPRASWNMGLVYIKIANSV